MAKPPANLDPEKFLISGQVGYDNLRTARPYADDQVFRIEPAPFPVLILLAVNLFLAAFAFVLYWEARQGGSVPLMVAYLVIGFLTDIFCSLFLVYRYSRDRRLGPWLIYDKATGCVELPRQGVTFQRDEIVHLQYITTKHLDWPRGTRHNRNSELNLITCKAGVRRRWPLLRSAYSVRAFDYLLKPLLRHTDLPVMRVKDGWRGWQVTETPYRCGVRAESP